MTTTRFGGDGSLRDWLETLPDAEGASGMITLLRAAAGGGGPISAEAAGYFRPGPRSPAEIARLCRDGAMRRRVAAAGRILGAPAVRSAIRPARPRWTWWVVSAGLAAASLAVLVLSPGGPSPVGQSHRALPVAPADFQVISVSVTPGSELLVAWHGVLGAENYEVEVTGANGRVLLTTSTVDTMLVLPRAGLASGARYFARVRARIEVGRWIASDFREFRIE